jgi:hypothetical protein
VLWASLTGFFVGGWASSHNAAATYIKDNADTKFKSQFDMQRGLSDNIIKNFFQHGARWGWKLGVFMGMFG